MTRFIQKVNRQLFVILSVFYFFTISVIQADDSSLRSNPKIDFRSKHINTPHSLAEFPVVKYLAHNRGNIQLAVANNGTFGTEGTTIQDPFTGDAISSCVYPKNSDIVFLWVGALWVGAIVGSDTLVSCATEDWYRTNEFWPDLEPLGDFVIKSIDVNSPYYAADAFSEEDFICTYTDTVTNPSIVERDPIDGRDHKPLNIKVEQRTMSWSYSYADDFILFDYKIENIGHNDLKEVYLGIFVDGDVWHVTRNNAEEGWNDDIVGFYRSHPAGGDCGFIDTINVAFTADNDGDPVNGRWDYRSTLSTVGSRVVRTPSDSLKYSYNWWIINYGDATRDFGPRRQIALDDPFRDLNGRLGTPAGDRNKYYVMSHEEFDYDLMYLAIDQTRNGWLRPPAFARDFAQGYDARYLLSFGPFNISPGEQLPITFAWVGGEDFHLLPNDFDDFFDPDDPDKYYSKLNFNNLAINSRWASWVFDNPGVDTDGDGYLGKFRVCNNETIYYEGDGVPDFKGASPPPAPKFWVTPSSGSLNIRFNGFNSETTKDGFSNLRDFEGYRIYLARDDRTSSYSVVASYDLEDYNRYIINLTFDTVYSTVNGESVFTVDVTSDIVLKDVPFTLDSLRCLYANGGCGDNSFNPLDYNRTSPLFINDSVFYFEPQDFNVSELGVNTPITKRFPNQPYPSTFDKDIVDPSELTDDGYFKFFEYETTIDNLLPTVPYWVNITAFDFGSPIAGLESLETSVTVGTEVAYALNSSAEVEAGDLDVYVYPNPYRTDGGYSRGGYENRLSNLAQERARIINFANLPPKCNIKIFSIDGDLVKEIIHDVDPNDPTSSHDEWDLISRNTQSIVSGLYYFVIESEKKSQIGKIVIIK